MATFFACSDPVSELPSPVNDTLPSVDTVVNLPPAPDPAQLQDSLDKVVIALEALRENFIEKQEDFDWPSYYHKNWFGRYSIKATDLMAGVDSTGRLFMISNYKGGAEGINHTEVQVVIGQDTLITDPGLDTLSHLMRGGPTEIVICACILEVRFFYSASDHGILEAISNCGDAPVTVILKGDIDHRYALPERDRSGIRDCWHLARLMREEQRLRRQLVP